MLVFVKGGKLEYPEKNPHSKERTNNKLNPRNKSTGPEPNAGHIGGRGALSLLHLPAPQTSDYNLVGKKLSDQRNVNCLGLQWEGDENYKRVFSKI